MEENIGYDVAVVTNPMDKDFYCTYDYIRSGKEIHIPAKQSRTLGITEGRHAARQLAIELITAEKGFGQAVKEDNVNETMKRVLKIVSVDGNKIGEISAVTTTPTKVEEEFPAITKDYDNMSWNELKAEAVAANINLAGVTKEKLKDILKSK